VRILARRTVVLGDRLAFRATGAVGSPKGFILGHTVVCAVELHVGDAVVTLDTSSLLKSLGNLIVNFSEDGDLSLDDLLLSAHLHFAGNVTDKSVTRRIVENLLPEVSWCIKVLSSYLRQEGNGLAGEISVMLAITPNQAFYRVCTAKEIEDDLPMAHRLLAERVIDLVYVGEPKKVDPKLIELLVNDLETDYIPVIAPIGVSEGGDTYNINADTVAGALAGALDREAPISDLVGRWEDGSIKQRVLSRLQGKQKKERLREFYFSK